MNADELLKKATELKKSGNINDAVNTLREAYHAIEKDSIDYPIETYLRLPLYLQTAKRSDEAWSEFNKLIVNPPKLYKNNEKILFMAYSIIFDKMRLFLQKENKHIDAIKCDILSYLYWGAGLKLQDRLDEYEYYTQKEVFQERLIEILKKANKEEYIKEFVELIEHEIAILPRIDKNAIDSLMNKISK